MTHAVWKSEVDKWVGSVITSRDRRMFPELRKQVQGALVQALLVEGFGEEPVNGDVAYALMLLLSGRGAVPEFLEISKSADPPGFQKALALYERLPSTTLTHDVELSANFARSFEITNEVAFGTLENALLIANEGIRLWPVVAELVRQRGIIMLAQGRFSDAITDLERAKSMQPTLIQLEEPLQRAKSLYANASISAHGDYATVASIGAFNRTPFQIFLLTTCTFGFYSFFYLIYNYRLAERRLQRVNIRPWWTWILSFIPFVGAYFFYGGFSYIGRRVRASNISLPLPFGLQALLLYFSFALTKLPDPWWLSAFAVSGLILANMQRSLVQAQRTDFPELPKARLTTWEIVIIVIGAIMIGLAGYGSTLPS